MKIKIIGVSKKYMRGKKALEQIDMTIGDGVFGLLGENGAGKTTLLKTIATIIPVQEGSIVMDKLDICKDVIKVRSKIGYQPQSFDFFENLTLYEMLEYLMMLKSGDSFSDSDEIHRMIKKLNLTDKTHSKIKNLSGGMKQRAAIAQALIGDSDLVILDEPTAGLDPTERLRFRNIIAGCRPGQTIIISTHIISDIAMLCDNVAIMKNGRVLYCGTVEKLLDNIDGKVFIMQIKLNESIDIDNHDRIISVTRKKTAMEIRYISESEASQTTVQPTLEDAYFYYMHSER